MRVLVDIANYDALFDERSHRFQRSEVQLAIEHVLVACLLDNVQPSGFAALEVAAGHVNASSAACHVEGVRFADAGVAARDDDHLAVETFRSVVAATLDEPSARGGGGGGGGGWLCRKCRL